mgnify:CR=1 FL=1
MSLKPLSELPTHAIKPKRALLSVSDKTGISELGTELHNQGVELISTGGTAKALRDAGLPVTDVSEITQFEECLDGRVKTLHPVIHAGILARTSHAPDNTELERLNIDPIDLVVVNLYPFEEAISDDNVTPAIATENIDIGGPTMVRASAKNFAHVCILSNPGQYDAFIGELKQNGEISFATRRTLGRKAFEHTAAYDAAISRYFNALEALAIPDQFSAGVPRSDELRYGENPHQKAGVYGHQEDFIDCFHGKQLSYNNYLDLDAALQLIADFPDDQPAVAIFKHTVACGVAVGKTQKEAYQKAFSTDTSSPFGGIICCNQPLTLAAAQEIDKIFTEIIIAPGFEDDALDLLKQKKNRRLVTIKQLPGSEHENSYKSIFGGLLLQQENRLLIDEEKLQIPTKRKPTEQEMQDLRFSWAVVKHIKSNAIVYARDMQTVGIGTGQPSRIDSSELAIRKAEKEGLSIEGTVVASDAFFPFADGVEAAAKAGATAIIQPGGSIRDEEVIEMADKYDIAMIFTGIRHFRH